MNLKEASMEQKKRIRHFLLVVLLLAVALPLAASDTNESGTSAELGVVTAPIVGGGPAGQGENRWMTSLQRGGHFCGASLIGDRWVVTAAHCVIGEKPAGMKVWVGGHDLRYPGQGEAAKVKKIYIHPKYNDNTLRNDIALIKLKKPISSSIPRVEVANSQITNKDAKPGKVATVSGWGALSENGASPKVLHRVKLPIVSNAECNSPGAYGGDVFGTNICAGLKQGGKDSCYGDSGGPLWIKSGGKDHLVGIVSWGEGCAEPRKYGVYTRVAAFEQWIDSKMKSGGGGSNPDPNPGPGPRPGSGSSCQGSCGGNAGNCWCDADCTALGDCCSDIATYCGGGSQDTCTTKVCDVDAYCCNVEWDGLCDDLADEICS
jgi:secreted trypsin-like serine protease